jgi:hypothetical protein
MKQFVQVTNSNFVTDFRIVVTFKCKGVNYLNQQILWVPSNRPLGLRVPRWHLQISELASVPSPNLGTRLGAIFESRNSPRWHLRDSELAPELAPVASPRFGTLSPRADFPAPFLCDCSNAFEQLKKKVQLPTT